MCDRCGHPISTARHPDNDGFFEVTAAITCHGCTALANYDRDGKHEPVEYLTVSDTRDYEASPLPPLRLAPLGDRPPPASSTPANRDSTLGG